MSGRVSRGTEHRGIRSAESGPLPLVLFSEEMSEFAFLFLPSLRIEAGRSGTGTGTETCL